MLLLCSPVAVAVRLEALGGKEGRVEVLGGQGGQKELIGGRGKGTGGRRNSRRAGQSEIHAAGWGVWRGAKEAGHLHKVGGQKEAEDDRRVVGGRGAMARLSGCALVWAAVVRWGFNYVTSVCSTTCIQNNQLQNPSDWSTTTLLAFPCP